MSACVAFTLSDGSHRLMAFVVALVFPLRTTNKTSVPICGHNGELRDHSPRVFNQHKFCVERPVDDTTFNLPTPTMPFPYKNLIDYCTTQQRNALRYDMNLVDDDDPNHKFFPTWSEMQAEKKWHPADTPCSMCGLFVALFGFGCYFKNTIEPELGSHIIWHICKACFRFSDSNPRFDWETMTTTAPPVSARDPCFADPSLTSLRSSALAHRVFWLAGMHTPTARCMPMVRASLFSLTHPLV